MNNMGTIIKVIGTVIVFIGMVYLIKADGTQRDYDIFRQRESAVSGGNGKVRISDYFFLRRASLRDKMGNRAVWIDIPLVRLIDFYVRS
jgi:hypothetical protein